MSISAGIGSPIAFMCHRLRRGRYRHQLWAPFHEVTRTGRTRPYSPARGSALGVRSMLTSYEYQCSCGHLGWTNHRGIMTKRYAPLSS